MLTVPEAARRLGRNPETVRRWIREGRLTARKVGTQHVIEEADLDAVLDDEQLPLPPEWQTLPDGSPMPNIVRAVRLSRAGH
jgi:excisionase family DNA binding protein